MPNLTPPLTHPTASLEYMERLKAQDSSVTYLPTLYLHPDITPAIVAEAAKAGIKGIKSYPAGVTTNSDSGVLDYESFYPVFAAMQEHGLILNLHGECPSSHTHGSSSSSITILNAEPRFLPTLISLNKQFPSLKIVLEHCTTAAAVLAVQQCGPTVVGTITAHHLFLTIDDWASDPFAYCKPVAKTPEDRTALLQAVVRGKGKFLFGTDSAPHDVRAKTPGKGGKTAAGVFTQPYATQLVFGALEEAVEMGVISAEEVTEEVLSNFLGGYGRAFYGIRESEEKFVMRKGSEVTQEALSGNGVEVVPFRAGKSTWTVEWLK